MLGTSGTLFHLDCKQRFEVNTFIITIINVETETEKLSSLPRGM